MGDLPKWKTWRCFQYWSCEIHENDFRLMLWNTWKWFQQWFCEIHESDFNNGSVKYMKVISKLIFFFVKYMKVISTFVLWNTWKWFQISIVKYMKVISTMVLWNTWKWFQHWFFLWNTWKWFQHFCEIHESDFNNELHGWWKILKEVIPVWLRSDL